MTAFDIANDVRGLALAIATGNWAQAGGILFEHAVNAAVDRIPFGRYLRGPVDRFLRGMGVTPEWIGAQLQQRSGTGGRLSSKLDESDFARNDRNPGLNRIRGADFEALALARQGLEKNTTRLGGNRRGRGGVIPDGKDLFNYWEIKDEVNLSNTRQLRTMVERAEAAGKPLNLIVSPRNQSISGPLKNSIIDRGGRIYRYTPDFSDIYEVTD